MLNLTGAKWNTHRRIMAPAMTGPYLRKSVAQMNNSLQALVALWSVKSQLAKGKPFGVLRDTENAAMVWPVLEYTNSADPLLVQRIQSVRLLCHRSQLV